MSVPIEEQQQEQQQEQEQQQQSIEHQSRESHSLEPQRLDPQSLEPQSRETEEPQRHKSKEQVGSSNQKKIVTFSGSSFEVSDSEDEESGQPLRPNHSLTTVSSSSPLAARIESKHCLDAAKHSPQKSPPKKEKED